MVNERLAVCALRASGWSESRHVDISRDLSELGKNGFPRFEALVDFLHSYSGVTVRLGTVGIPEEAWFSGAGAAELIGAGWIADYSQRAGVPLVPVGAAHRDYLILLIGEDGSWYGGYDDEFGSLGADFMAALENLIKREGFVRRL